MTRSTSNWIVKLIEFRYRWRRNCTTQPAFSHFQIHRLLATYSGLCTCRYRPIVYYYYHTCFYIFLRSSGLSHCRLWPLFSGETKNNLYVIKAPWCMHVKRSTIMSTHMHIMPGDLCNLKHWKQIANHFNSRTKRRPLIFVSSWCDSYCQSHRPKSEHGIHSSSTAFHEMTSTSKGSICNAHIHKPKTCVCLSPSWRRRIIIKDWSIIIKNLTIRWENILLA